MTSQDDNAPVIDTNEAVETISDEEPRINIMGNNPTDDSGADGFLNLESLIKNYLTQINNLKAELRKFQDLYTDAFEGDVIYKEHEEKAKEAAKVKNETKSQILKQPTLASLSEKISEIKTNIKELQDTLSDYLLQYQKSSGLSEIETDEGETLIIVQSAKLVKGSSRK
jgi:vacuolar-type H+-ATPase subunit I/STV1